MRPILAAILAMCVGACATSARDTALQGLNLGDRATLAALQEGVPIDQRGALATYALLHWPQSKFYCGKPIDPAQKMPRTIGEAIDQTLAYEARRMQAIEASRVPADALDRLLDRQQQLISQTENLVLNLDMLKDRLGPGAAKSADYTTVAAQLADLREELADLRAQIPAQAASREPKTPTLRSVNHQRQRALSQ